MSLQSKQSSASLSDDGDRSASSSFMLVVNARIKDLLSIFTLFVLVKKAIEVGSEPSRRVLSQFIRSVN